MAKQFLAMALHGGSRGRERGNPAIRRIGNDGGPQSLHYAGSELPEGYVVGADVFRSRSWSRVLILDAHLVFPLGRFLWRKHRFILEPHGALERSGGAGIPDSREVRM